MKKIFMGILFLISLNYAADFACVDFQKVLMQSKYVAKIQKEFRTLVQSYQAKLTKKQKKLESLRKELQQGVLSEKARKKKEEEIQKLEMEIRKLQLEAQEKLNKKSKELEKKVFQKLQEVLKDIAKKKKLKVVFYCESMIYHEPKVDITSEVLKRLDLSK